MGSGGPGVLLILSRWRTTFGWLFYALVAVLGGGSVPAIAAGAVLAVAGEAFRSLAAGVIAKNAAVAQGGPYALCRHPLYFGSFLIALGLSVAAMHPAVWAAFIVCFPLLYIPTMAREERFLLSVFGDGYRAYRGRVPAFFPRSLRLSPAPFSRERYRANRESVNWLALAACLLVLLAKALLPGRP